MHILTGILMPPGGKIHMAAGGSRARRTDEAGDHLEVEAALAILSRASVAAPMAASEEAAAAALEETAAAAVEETVAVALEEDAEVP